MGYRANLHTILSFDSFNQTFNKLTAEIVVTTELNVWLPTQTFQKLVKFMYIFILYGTQRWTNFKRVAPSRTKQQVQLPLTHYFQSTSCRLSSSGNGSCRIIMPPTGMIWCHIWDLLRSNHIVLLGNWPKHHLILQRLKASQDCTVSNLLANLLFAN